MMTVYVIDRSDGGVTRMHCPNAADLEKAVKDWKIANPQWSVVSITPIVDEPDHEFFDGWKHVGGGRIGFDMDKCREVHKRRLREARAPMLAALDVDYQRADEAGDNKRKRDIAQEKQRLRDVTADPRIAAAQTVDDLKNVWPL